MAVVGDAGRIEQAMLNLMTNAVQHTVDGDEIGLGFRLDADRALARAASQPPPG